LPSYWYCSRNRTWFQQKCRTTATQKSASPV